MAKIILAEDDGDHAAIKALAAKYDVEILE